MKFEPYPYQREAIRWLLDRPAAGLFLGMGMGKTVCALTAVDRLIYDRLEVCRVLVIAPKRVAEDTWAKEAAKWNHLQHLRVVKIMGTREQRLAVLHDLNAGYAADVYVINRENVAWLCELVDSPSFGGWPFDMVIVDELSSFKSAQSKRFRALRRRLGSIRRIVGLTGTPAPGGLIDLWPQIYLLDRGQRLGRTLSAYRASYFVPDRTNGHIVYSYRPVPGAQEQIHSKLADLCMSLKKEDWLHLPGQMYETVELTLSPAMMKKYRDFEREKVMEAAAGGDIVALSASALNNKILHYANGAVYDTDGGVTELHSVKLDALEELIEAAAGEPVLVLYAFRHDRDRICRRIPCRGLETAADIDDWNAGRIPVAIAHPASVGHGLNLQAGGHILIWYGLTWSLELYQQANERLNRPGQTHVCRIYHLTVKGTHDERVLGALEKKDAGQQALIDALKRIVEEYHGET